MTRSAKGFTLIELLVVVAIIGILVSIGVGQYARSIQEAREAVLKENLFQTRNAIQLYFVDKKTYPQDLMWLVDEHYLLAPPVDTVTRSASTWVVVNVVPDERDISLEPGIFNVFSGATGLALDGTRYSDW